MRKYLKRHIGQILLDAGFLSRQVLASALHEQKRTREKLGQVLVRMGVVKAPDMKASLLAQKYLSNIEDAVKMAAGDRQMLGSLLVESGRMSDADLDRAIAEQQRTGAKLGEVLVRLGFVSQPQLYALLNFQTNQAAHASSPFRLGELLVTTGDLSRKHLKAALAKQSVSRKKLGEVLVEEGYLRLSQVEHGIGLQKMLMHAVLAAILSFGVVSTSNASDFELTWDPSPDTSVVGYKVYYQADSEVQPFQGSGSVDGAAPINVGSGVTTTVRGLTPGHTYYFAVTAYDDSGTESVYSNIISLDAPLPSTTITFPASNQSVSGALTIQADSLNNPSVSALQFFVNGTLQGFDTSAPYEQTWDTSGLAPGSYTLTAKAVDSSGNVTESSGVSVQVTATDSTAPSVSLTAPQNSTVVSGATTISATATDDVGVSRVEFFLNGELLYAGNSAPFTFSWDTSSVANGVHTLVAKAYDAAGHAAQTSDISVMVNNVVPDTDAPAVTSFTMPATANNLSVAISSYAASDNIAVAGYLVTESAAAPSAGAAGWSDTAPSSFTFSAAGARTAYAWAKDAAGNISVPASSNVTITLPDTAAPTISSFVMASSADSLTVAISSFAASDNVGVAGYLVTESAIAPTANASGWSATPPSSFTFSAAGTRTAYAWTKDAAGNVSAAAIRSITITLPDTVIPAVSLFVMPSSSDSLTVGISSFAASDNVAVAGFLVTESATAPAAGASGWSTAPPSSFTFSGPGARTAYAWTKDAAGNVSLPLSRSVTITLSDTEVPNVTSFTMPANAASLTVGISTFAASDNVGVIGYLVTESAAAPSAGAAGWSATALSSFTFSAAGARTAYAWTKDAAGNVSAPVSSNVTITLPDTAAPAVSSFVMPTNAASLTVAISSFAANDNVGVTGYLVTESATAPAANAADWSASAPTSFTFSAAGTRTAYAWSKDAAGNVSGASIRSVTITLPDTAIPTVSSFVIPASSDSLTVGISSFAGSDNVSVAGYLVTESATAPAAGASGWSTAPPSSFTFSGSGTKTAYAWTKDAAGNVSLQLSRSVTITLSDTDVPDVTSFSMPSSAASLTVGISTFAASDNVGVIGYLVTESAAAPSASAAGWSATAPSSFTFSAAGARTAYAWTKDAAGNVSAAATSSVTITLPDTAAPAVSSFVMPTSAASLTVAISSFAASDNVGVAGYLVTESATAPAANASGWSATPPSSFTFSAAGTRTAYAWTKDAAGNVSAAAIRSITITLPDTVIPAVSLFVMPSSSDSLTVGISSFAASDNVAVAGFLVTESATAPAAGASGWSTSSPSSFTFSGPGARTAYAWTKDAAGNVSLPLSRSVTITLSDTDVPDVTSFTMPASAASLTVGISTFAASDNVGVIGYLVTESAAAPSAGAAGWSATALSSFTFSAAGARTAYAWTKDAAGNVSAPVSSNVTITLPDTAAPAVSSFVMPTNAASLTVAISSFAASDNVGVTGYLVNESATAPTANASGWSASAPTSFTFSAAGTRTAYAWTKDAAGNVSAAATSSVTITLPDMAAPAISSFVMPTSAASLTVAISSFAASDNVGVAGYLVTESATAPTAYASGWSAIAPASFTFSAAGTRTAYAWTKDAAGNVSAASTRNVTIMLPQATESLTIGDALLALNIAAGKVTPTAEQIARLDVGPYIDGKSSPDGVVNTGDVVVLLSKITGKDPAKR